MTYKLYWNDNAVIFFIFYDKSIYFVTFAQLYLSHIMENGVLMYLQIAKTKTRL